MCTVTWRSEPGILDVFCNRDEQRTRAPAQPPRIAVQGAHAYIAPTDPDGGGSWIAVNECGVCVTLLNYYERDLPHAKGPFASRGGLVLSLMSHAGRETMEPVMQSDFLHSFRPFMLLTFQGQHPPHKYTWDGVNCWKEEMNGPLPMVTTSSFQPSEVIEQRLRSYAAAVPALHHPGADQLRAFHAGHNPEKGAYSVCMHREDAHTVSFSHVHIRPDRITFRYRPGAPCTPDAATEVVQLNPV